MFVVNNKHIKEANIVFYGSLTFLSVAAVAFAAMCGV